MGQFDRASAQIGETWTRRGWISAQPLKMELSLKAALSIRRGYSLRVVCAGVSLGGRTKTTLATMAIRGG